ncbi:DUF1223 domain-containing protein [Ramlibacter sp. PS4R-6]|uniref:DUF1223 domain-containing protein n=1 Tax=Ramlibacter sp. PS4R-6 TaxID=3133438 RepID=UPI0030B55A80
MTDLRAALAGACALAGASAIAADAPAACRAQSAAALTPVIELYTSEGCSSCPPADRWISTLKDDAARGRVVAQAFHVGYWDYIGWVDRFANPAHTQRQRQVASWNGLPNIYTPQVVRNGQDWRSDRVFTVAEPARASIDLQQTTPNAFAAAVVPADGVGAWGAYWTVTEHGHASKVKAGENAGEYLRHDFVVRQYVPAGDRRGPAQLTLLAIPPDKGHARQVNLVVYDARNGRTLQALSLACG